VKGDRERIVEVIQAIRGLKSIIVELNYLVFPLVSNPPILILYPARSDGLRYQLYNEYNNLYLYIIYQVRKI
jgi:hypothetical protein